MDHVKDDRFFAERIRTDLKFVMDHTAGKSRHDIEKDEVDSILFRIIQIAENNGKLSDEFKAAHPDVPWLAIKGMRNRIVHDYGFVDLGIVYDTVTRGIPRMYESLKNI